MESSLCKVEWTIERPDNAIALMSNGKSPILRFASLTSMLGPS